MKFNLQPVKLPKILKQTQKIGYELYWAGCIVEQLIAVQQILVDWISSCNAPTCPVLPDHSSEGFYGQIEKMASNNLMQIQGYHMEFESIYRIYKTSCKYFHSILSNAFSSFSDQIASGSCTGQVEFNISRSRHTLENNCHAGITSQHTTWSELRLIERGLNIRIESGNLQCIKERLYCTDCICFYIREIQI